MTEDDLFDEITLPSVPQRRWTDRYEERRGIARQSPNGHVVAPVGGYEHVCAGCGIEFTSNRRRLPERKSWCGKPECRRLAAAERAQSYRERKAQEMSR